MFLVGVTMVVTVEVLDLGQVKRFLESKERLIDLLRDSDFTA